MRWQSEVGWRKAERGAGSGREDGGGIFLHVSSGNHYGHKAQASTRTAPFPFPFSSFSPSFSSSSPYQADFLTLPSSSYPS